MLQYRKDAQPLFNLVYFHLQFFWKNFTLIKFGYNITRFDYNKQAKFVLFLLKIALYDYDCLIFIAFYGIFEVH